MRKDFGAKPYTYPQPVLMIATYGEDGKPDVMNAAWGGISDDKEISICVSENHKTTENILKKGAFTVSMADVEHMTACDYVGIVSGNKEPDKFVKAGFTAEKSEKVDIIYFSAVPALKASPTFSPRRIYALLNGSKVIGAAFATSTFPFSSRTLSSTLTFTISPISRQVSLS